MLLPPLPPVFSVMRALTVPLSVCCSQALCRLGRLHECLASRCKAVRHMSARCLAACARLQLHTTLASVVQHVLPLLGEYRRPARLVATRCHCVQRLPTETLNRSRLLSSTQGANLTT